MQKSKRAKVSTPSRICLMGEHQDYLGLEVIAQAINLRFNAKGKLRNDGLIKLKMKGENIELFEVIDLKKKIVYKNQRDYIKSTINILKKYNYDI